MAGTPAISKQTLCVVRDRIRRPNEVKEKSESQRQDAQAATEKCALSRVGRGECGPFHSIPPGFALRQLHCLSPVQQSPVFRTAAGLRG